MPISRPTQADPVPAIVWLLLGVMVVIEAAASAGDALILPVETRLNLYLMGAFWDQSFDAALEGRGTDRQLLWSMLSYAVLHGGFVHLAMNGVIFLALGKMIAKEVGSTAFVAFLCVTAIGGALGFGLIASSNYPMVGASGVVFGMFGTIYCWRARMLEQAGLSILPVLKFILGLVVLNIVLALVLDGLLAWETHLGGFVAGWMFGRLVRPRRG